MAAINPQIDEQVRVTRDEIAHLDTQLAALARAKASKVEALTALESLGLHTPPEAPAAVAKPAVEPAKK